MTLIYLITSEFLSAGIPLTTVFTIVKDNTHVYSLNNQKLQCYTYFYQIN